MEQLTPLISALKRYRKADFRRRFGAPTPNEPHLLGRPGDGPGHRPRPKRPQTRPPPRPQGSFADHGEP